MKQYKYVKLKYLNGSLAGYYDGNAFGMANWFLDKEDYRQIIDECAKKDYRYVGYIPTKISDHSGIEELDLVFEKDC